MFTPYLVGKKSSLMHECFSVDAQDTLIGIQRVYGLTETESLEIKN